MCITVYTPGQDLPDDAPDFLKPVKIRKGPRHASTYRGARRNAFRKLCRERKADGFPWGQRLRPEHHGLAESAQEVLVISKLKRTSKYVKPRVIGPGKRSCLVEMRNIAKKLGANQRREKRGLYNWNRGARGAPALTLRERLKAALNRVMKKESK